MTPTFKSGEGLDIKPYDEIPARRGDVVIFKHPMRTVKVVHRVVSICSDGAIRTQGDNNSLMDPWVLKKQDLLGKVIFKSKGSGKRPVLNGTAGIAYFHVQQILRAFLKKSWKLFRPFYLLVKKSPLKNTIITHYLKPRLVIFEREKGKEIHMLLGRRLIARKQADSDKWQVPLLMRVLLDDDVLKELLKKNRLT
jgi:hypothetical protein